LAAGDAQGVKSVYTHIISELQWAMLLSGVAKVTDLKRENIVLPKV
jgi:isopentenyl diphosphate isomerase/L-lactate dehydrogenase-like FMN-dependent dehydrogenase